MPRALYLSIAIGASLFVFFAYATVTGFHYDVSSIGRSSVPFLTVADHYLGGRRSWRGSPGSSPCSPPWSPARTRRRGCSSTAGARGCSRLGSAACARQATRRSTHSWRWPGSASASSASGGSPHAHRRGPRLHEPRRSLRRVLHHGHDRHPVRLSADGALAPGLHVAPSPQLFSPPERRVPLSAP